jgi:hypothetical protein
MILGMSLLALAVVLPARYVFHVAGAWRGVYVIGASIALYFNVFVAVVQSFLKIPVLHALAPAGKEPPFLVAQVIVLLIFIGLTVRTTKRFHIDQPQTA